MRIALVTERFDPSGGGAERSASQIAAGLVACGHQVTVLTGDSPPGLELERTVVLRCPSGMPRKGLTLLLFVHWVRAQLRSGHFHSSLATVTWLPADVLQPRPGIIAESRQRFLARRRSVVGRLLKRLEWGLSLKHWLMKSLERRQLTRGQVKHVVAISRYMKEQIIRHYGVGEDRITVIANGAEMPAPQPGWRDRVRARFSIGAQTPLFLFVANEPWRKGLGPLLEALERIENCALLVAGRTVPAVARLVRKKRLEGRVHLAGEAKSVAEFYCAADVTVLPSYYDPASKVVIESLLMGTPAITTVYNGARDFVDGGDGSRCGRVIDDPDDIDALARAMTELTDPGERQRCREAVQKIGAALSMRRHVESLEGLLIQVARTSVRSVQ